jgi:hypothetical protein
MRKLTLVTITLLGLFYCSKNDEYIQDRNLFGEWVDTTNSYYCIEKFVFTEADFWQYIFWPPTCNNTHYTEWYTTGQPSWWTKDGKIYTSEVMWRENDTSGFHAEKAGTRTWTYILQGDTILKLSSRASWTIYKRLK